MSSVQKYIFSFLIIIACSSIQAMDPNQNSSQTATEIAKKTINYLTLFNAARFGYDLFQQTPVNIGMLLLDMTAMGVAALYYLNKYEQEHREPIPMHENPESTSTYEENADWE